MILKFFGLMDLIAAGIFLLAQWGFGINIALFVAIYLILKSLLFIPDFASIVDMIGGAYLLLVVFNIHSIFSAIFVLWFLQKGIFSLAV